jgi:hypothetical protein
VTKPVDHLKGKIVSRRGEVAIRYRALYGSGVRDSGRSSQEIGLRSLLTGKQRQLAGASLYWGEAH